MVLEGVTGAFPGDASSRAGSDSICDLVNRGKAHSGAAPISAAAWPRPRARADRAYDRKPFQVPGLAQGRRESGTSFFDILRCMHRVSCSGNLGRGVSDVSQGCKGKPCLSGSSRLWNAVHILLRTAASLVWVSWSQGVKSQLGSLVHAVCSVGEKGRP